MAKFLIRRLLLAIPVLFGILVVTFALARVIPGDPCVAVLGERATEELCDAYFKRYGLDKPISEQFIDYSAGVFQGDFGFSFRRQIPVVDIIAETLPTTVELTVWAVIFAVLVGVPLGIVSAYRHNSPIDVLTMLIANIGVSMPVFWLGLVLVYVFGVWILGTPLSFLALPPGGRLTAGIDTTPFYTAWGLVGPDDTVPGIMIFLSRLYILNGLLTLNFELVGDTFKHLLLPAVAVGTIPLAIIARMMRSSLLEVLNQDYVRTARAKGLAERRVVLSHAVRNAMLPVVTVIGLNFGFLVGGAVLTETIFGFTGIGKTLFDGITSRDYSIVQGMTLMTAIAFVFINLFVDMLYGYLDPRIRMD